MGTLEAWFLGSRKFIVMLTIILLSCSFRLTGYITSPDFTTIISNVGMAFMAANSIEQMMAPLKEWAQGKFSDKD